VRVGHLGVVGEHRHRLEDVVDERLSRRSLSSARQGHVHQQLGHGHGGDGDVVVIGHDRIQVAGGALDVNQEGRVQQQPAQGRFSTDSRRPAGSSCAITLPRRMMR
jgi:hypothetical protein